MPTKNELLELAEEIKKCMECPSPYEKMTNEKSTFFRDLFLEGPWFFPPKNSVKGFLGTGSVMFVADKPAAGKPFKSEKDPIQYFYNVLERYGFSNAHITDSIKCRGKVKEKICKEQFENCKKWLLKEIELVNPELIVAVGKNAYSRLRTLKLSVPLKMVPHYGYIKYMKKEDRGKLEQKFKSLKD